MKDFFIKHSLLNNVPNKLRAFSAGLCAFGFGFGIIEFFIYVSASTQSSGNGTFLVCYGIVMMLLYSLGFWLVALLVRGFAEMLEKK